MKVDMTWFRENDQIQPLSAVIWFAVARRFWRDMDD